MQTLQSEHGKETRVRELVARVRQLIEGPFLARELVRDALEARAHEAEGQKKVDVAKIVGSKIAELAIEKGIKEVKFDKGSYKYHGRLKVLADAAREKGLSF